MSKPVSRPPFVLVHGAWHGAWCWYRIVSRLRAGGDRVTALDLPGHGVDRTDRSALTLDSYADAVIAALEQQTAPAILVVHSMSGIVASTVAERRPDLVAALVYVTAFLLPDGHTIGSHGETSGLISDFSATLLPPDTENTVGIAPGRRREFLYGDSPAEDAELARILLTRQPAGPLADPVRVTSDRFGSVPRFYVRCTRDRGITPEMQDQMLRQTPCDAVRTLDTDHSPFFSRPDELTAMLREFAALATARAS